jgi:hypothetical protein
LASIRHSATDAGNQFVAGSGEAKAGVSSNTKPVTAIGQDTVMPSPSQPIDSRGAHRAVAINDARFRWRIVPTKLAGAVEAIRGAKRPGFSEVPPGLRFP